VHDYHLHSNFSCDCQAPMAEMCRAAIARGLPEIGFTEHYDLHPGEKEFCDWFQLEPWAQELQRCRAEFAGRLVIRAGVEIGEPHRFAAQAAALLARYPFDYVLGSLHWVGDDSMFDPAYFRRHPAPDAFRAFYEELARMTALGGFDVLSHFDVPIRTAFPIYGRYDPREHEAWIRPVLANCVANGLALDINTAALRGAANVLTPGVDILRWYVELGGQRVTLGSDAHRPENIGAHLEAALAAARAAGIQYLTYFEGRRPQLRPLPAAGVSDR
jgi:histidinol-phosphatase (PHP family)